jgi:hypothetical protein
MVMAIGGAAARWRGLSPARNSLARLTAIALGLAWLGWMPVPHTVCPLLALTGVPCPFCGGTHAGIDLARGHPAAALRASPIAVLGAAALIVLPLLRRTGLAQRWRNLPAKARNLIAIAGIVTALAVSELWQLARFGLIAGF